MGVTGFIKSILGICQTKPLNRDLWSLEGNKAQVKLSQIPTPLPKGSFPRFSFHPMALAASLRQSENPQELIMNL